MLKWLAVLNPGRKVLDLILSPEIYGGLLWCWWRSHLFRFILFIQCIIWCLQNM